MQYLKDTMHIELVYGVHPQSKNKAKTKILAGQLPFGLFRYTDSNYTSDSEDQKLVIEYFFLYIEPQSLGAAKSKKLYLLPQLRPNRLP